MGLNFRGVHFGIFFLKFSFLLYVSFCPERPSFCSSLCSLYLTKESNNRFVSQGTQKQTFWDWWRFFRFVVFNFPLLNFGQLNRGSLTGCEIVNPRGEGEIQKPAALQRKKNIDGLELS